MVERFNQTVADGARTVLNDSNLDSSFWPEAMLYFVYSWNRVCSKVTNKTPHELYSGIKPSVRHLQPFGSEVFVGIPKIQRNKLMAKARQGIMVGYAFKTRGYRIWLKDLNKIIETSNVSFSHSKTDKSSSGAVQEPGRVDFYSPVGDNGVARDDAVEELSSSPDSSSSPSGTRVIDRVSDESSTEDNSLRVVSWYREAVPRKTGSRVDIYYFEKNKTERLRSLDDVEKYCRLNSIKYVPNLFNFSGKNHFSGDVAEPDDDEPEETDSSFCSFQA